MSSITLKVIREEHGTLAAILRSLRMLAERGPGKEAGTFFDAPSSKDAQAFVSGDLVW